jgi:uncharacterized repeat protein (TIGR04138 family)
MQSLNFDEILNSIVAQDPRYHREAYLFLREALEHTQRALKKAKKPEPQHVTGKELLDGIREYAVAQYGPMSKMVLNEWGIHATEDFGEIVFNMVDHGLLSKTPDDSRDHFKGGYDFDEAFARPFRPAKPDSVQIETPKKAEPT